ncbi:unnamed protein product [Trypanosoma congolense IL3000]|uniref:WGS project CAEQ00000000 data, annotated contig 741 n=1 Tax=Trypanosoma congolense (strain IL3000) TaxID=1068625 RepID=F9WI78_TRYCI|nr:unnamed protein product [Trypanosoma congolense IL3000]
MKCFGGEWNLFLENISSYLNLWHIFVYDDEEIEEHGLHGEECYRERRLVHPKYRKRVAESDSAYVRLGREARATLENQILDRVMRCERCKHGRLCKECTEGLMKLPCTSALCWITAVHRVKRVTGSRGLLAWDPLLPLVVTDNPSDAIPGGL